MGLVGTGLQFVQDGMYGRVPRRTRPALALVFQTLIALAERLQPAAGRRTNALVFALIAEKPA
jgi:hypothetical protein